MARISVIIAVKNMGEHIRSAVASVLLQSYGDFTVTVVDNGSSDDTVAIVGQMAAADKRVSLQHCATPGPFPCRNQAMRDMDCDYMAVMDGDDICLPNRFEEQIKALDQNAALAAVGSRIIQFGDRYGIPNMATTKEECRDLISLFNPCCHPTLMVRRSALDKAGPYDTSYAIGGDYDFVRRLTYCGDVVNLEQPLLLYRVHEKQITAQRKKDQQLTAYRVAQAHLRHLHNGRAATDAELLVHLAAPALRARWGLKRQAYRSLRSIVAVVAGKNGNQKA